MTTQTLTPYFTVPDGDCFIAFVTEVFGGAIIKEDRYDSGRIQHARIKIGASILMLNEATDTYPANTSQMHLYVRDVSTTFAAALNAGATALMQPNIRPHGDQMAGIKDPFGNIWWIATPQPA
ncbi:MAG: PhnB protein [Paracoccaceae bacterium]|jgi:PhnB protein